MRIRALTGAALLAGTVLAFGAGVLVAPSAGASTLTTITWDGSSFSASPTIHAGDSVRWFNNSNIAVRITSTTSNWSVDVRLGAGASSGQRRLSAAGSYGYKGVALLANDQGTVRVLAAPKPTTSPKPTGQPSPSHSPTQNPGTGHHHAGHPGASPSTSPPSTTGNGSAAGPPIGAGGQLPGHRHHHHGDPTPQVAGPPPGLNLPYPHPSPTPVVVHTLAQPVPARRLGMPAAIAVVLISGAVVGIVRVARS